MAAAEKAVKGNTDAIGTLQVAAAYLAAGDKAKAKAAAEKAIGMAEKNPGLKQYVEEQAKKYGVEAKGARRRTREEKERARLQLIGVRLVSREPESSKASAGCHSRLP